MFTYALQFLEEAGVGLRVLARQQCKCEWQVNSIDVLFVGAFDLLRVSLSALMM